MKVLMSKNLSSRNYHFTGAALIFGLTLASLLLAACGSNPTFTPTSTSADPNVTNSISSGGVSQPKVVASGLDANGGKIDFTEAPKLNDGIPVFLWFETQN